MSAAPDPRSLSRSVSERSDHMLARRGRAGTTGGGALNRSMRVNRPTADMASLVQQEKGSLEQYKQQLLTAMHRDQRLFNIEFPANRKASTRSLAPTPEPTSEPPPMVVVSIEDVVAGAADELKSSPPLAVPQTPPPSTPTESSSSPCKSPSDIVVVVPPDEADAMRDMWGNTVPEHLESAFLQWYEGFVATAHESNRAAQLLLDSLEDSDQRETRWFLCTRDPAHDIRHHARIGIAPNWRGRVYAAMLDLEARRRVAGHDVYGDLVKIVTREREPDVAIEPKLRLMYDQIERDVPRTFPDVVPFHVDYLSRLSTVLQVYSRQNGFGYTQGLNFIAGSLLFFFDDADAFHMLKHICESELSFYFSDGMIGLIADTELFELLVEQQLPKLWAHARKIGLSFLLITSQWFTCMFCKNFPLECCFRIWDLIFIDGGITRMFEFALRTLALFEPKLLRIHDDVDLVCALNLMVESLFDFDQLLKTKLPHPLVSANVQLARVRIRRRLLPVDATPQPSPSPARQL